MRFQVMGPVRISADDGRQLRLPRGRVRQLLCILLMAEHPVSAQVLCQWLARGQRPVAESTVRTHITGLRRALGNDGARIRVTEAGYMIHVASGELDVHRFEALAETGLKAVRDGDLLAAADVLRTADGMWTEPPFPDLPDVEPLWHQVRELTGRYLQVSESLIDVRLALGDHLSLIPKLRALCATDPPQERAHRQLMIALYRSGRKAEGYEVYQRLMRRLDTSYGVGPDSETEQLYSEILQADVSAGFNKPRDINCGQTSHH
jgi:DNA-binding SARP family transcriptional activator